MFTFLIVWGLGAGLSTAILLFSGYSSNDTLPVVYLPALVGLLMALAEQAARFHSELKPLRAMEKFLKAHMMRRPEFERLIDEVLANSAHEVKSWSDMSIQLHRRGVAGTYPDSEWNGGEEKAFETTKCRYEMNFKAAQSRFFEDYDRLKLFADKHGWGLLKERSWKLYADE